MVACKMAGNREHIELVPVGSDNVSPSCLHGPTLLFERMDARTKSPRQFFACSAFRDRKVCSFFQWADQHIDKSSACKTGTIEESFCHKKFRKRYFQFKKLSRSLRTVCCTCGLLLLNQEVSQHAQQGHNLKHHVSIRQLKHPSSLFTPLDNNRTYAQYLFSKNTIDFVVDTLVQLEFTHLLCVGAPRLHEEVQARRKLGAKISSLLLDLDERYAQMYSPCQFIKFNMFNHHFFQPGSQDVLTRFLQAGQDHLVLLTDPPFGGMVEALTSTFTRISGMRQLTHDKMIPLVWFFPYFMEQRIISQLPGVVMLDYKVDYENHALFNNQNKKKGSPVRIFTNLSPEKFILPESEGYWFCQPCGRWSAQENWHCTECGACTSKDGTKYVHCDVCSRCVKPSRVHCFTCQSCQLQDHKCGQSRPAGCHICGGLDHKRRECPTRSSEVKGINEIQNRALKRKMSNSAQKHKKKARIN